MQTTLFPITGSAAPQFSRGESAQKHALVEFFSHSKGSYRILRLLSRKRRPIGYKALMDEIRFDEKVKTQRRELPVGAIRAALCITQAAGLVRLSRHGFSITEVGREIHRRIESRRCVQMPKVRGIRSTSKDTSRGGATLSSANRGVLQELRKRAHTLIPQ